MGYKILIVDDESNIRNLIKKYAEFEGFEVLEAETGLEAYNICTNNTDIDLIIMDVMLPELDVFSSVKKI